MKKLIILISLLISVACFSQNKQLNGFNNTNLKQVLLEIEQLYNIQFSYNPKLIDNKTITISNGSYSIKEIINVLAKKTNLDFSLIKDDLYVIKPNHNIIICGYLTNTELNMPVEGATVYNVNTKRGTTTDEKGYFNLKGNTEAEQIDISFLGFKTISIEVEALNNQNCLDYALNPENQSLTEVVLSDYIASGISRQQDGSITFRPNNSEILSGLAEPDILQNIQLLPGIDSPSENASDINIRGGTPDQNLILIDGIKMYSTDHFYGTLSAFNPYIIKKADVYRSGVKAKYGDVIAGVMDMRLDDQVPKDFSAGIGVNLTHIEANAKIPLTKNIGVITSFRNSVSKYFDSPTFNRFSTKIFQDSPVESDVEMFDSNESNNSTDFGYADANLKVIADISSKDKIEATGLYTENTFDYLFQPEDEDVVRPFKIQSKTQNSGASLAWSSQWSDAFTTKVQGYSSLYDVDYFAQNNNFGPNYEEARKNEIKERGVRVESNISLNDKLTLNSGYQYAYSELNSVLRDFILEENRVRKENTYNERNTVFTELSLKTESLRTDFGIRSSYYSIFKKNYLEPRLYAEYNLGNGFRIKGSAEEKNQSISQVVEFFGISLGFENFIWVLGDNSSVPLLNSKQFSVGGLYSKKGWKVDVDIYTKKSKGLTGFGRGINLRDNQSAEGESTISGLDLLLKKRLGDYSVWLGYSYSKTEYVFDMVNNNKPFNANNDITNSITLSQFFKWRNFQLSLGYKYRAGIPYTKAIGITGEEGFEFIDYENFNASRLSDYKRMDFSVIYTFNFSKEKTTNARLGISLLNIFNSKNILSRRYQLGNVDNSVGIVELDKKGLAFTPNAFFRINF